MCGRYTLRTSAADLAEVFAVLNAIEWTPRFNIAPTQTVVAVRQNGQRDFALLRWGLIPSWASDPKIGNRMINARADTVATKPSFRSAFKSRRCLIATDGFYEWQKKGDAKQPFFIHRKDDQPFAFAGIWERWKREGEGIESCAIITTDANDLMKPLHDRMPVIIPPEEYDRWLAEPDTGLLQPYPRDDLEAYPVATIVNSPRNERPECVKKV
jgi:putative SOS response-associated peptidase YedK